MKLPYCSNVQGIFVHLIQMMSYKYCVRCTIKVKDNSLKSCTRDCRIVVVKFINSVQIFLIIMVQNS